MTSASLDDTCREMVGSLLHVKPIGGWGWRTSSNVSIRHEPPPFTAQLLWLWNYRGERRGGVARIDQPDHPFNGFWASFAVNVVGNYNFTDRICPSYYLALNETEPPHVADGWRNEDWPLICDAPEAGPHDKNGWASNIRKRGLPNPDEELRVAMRAGLKLSQ